MTMKDLEADIEIKAEKPSALPVDGEGNDSKPNGLPHATVDLDGPTGNGTSEEEGLLQWWPPVTDVAAGRMTPTIPSVDCDSVLKRWFKKVR